MLRFYNSDIVFSEVPDEVSLAINVTNCQNRCIGCHSPHLLKDIGQELTEGVIDKLISENKGITCFVFMGEGNDTKSLLELASYIKNKHGIKIALYSGRDVVETFFYDFWDYLKIGHYDSKFGALNKQTTNQRFYHDKKDITYKFWK